MPVLSGPSPASQGDGSEGGLPLSHLLFGEVIFLCVLLRVDLSAAYHSSVAMKRGCSRQHERVGIPAHYTLLGPKVSGGEDRKGRGCQIGWRAWTT